MERLKLLHSGENASWYAFPRDDPQFSRFCVTTPASRRICNAPECLGMAFANRLEQAVHDALRSAPFAGWIHELGEHRACVVHFLRGGLNFAMRGALHRAYGFNAHCSTFMSSQREKRDGEWIIREDRYRKLVFPPEVLLFAGDVVATGSTLDNGMQVMTDHLLEAGASVRGLVFFTIGGPRAEEILYRLHTRLRECFPAYEATCVVYLEGRFHLVQEGSALRIGIPGTDLVRQGAVLTPEFHLASLHHPAVPMERCVIYDAGSRAFAIPDYLEDVCGYWERVANLAREGWGIHEALHERWSALAVSPDDRYLQGLRQQWPGTDPALVERIGTRQAALKEKLDDLTDPAHRLLQLTQERLRTLGAAGPPRPEPA